MALTLSCLSDYNFNNILYSGLILPFVLSTMMYAHVKDRGYPAAIFKFSEKKRRFKIKKRTARKQILPFVTQ